MFRIVRTTTLDALRAQSTDLAALQRDLDAATTAAAMATDSAIRAETDAEDQLRRLTQAYADQIQAERDRDAARAERDQMEAAARTELEEIREDVARLRDAAAGAETGESVRHAIAYGVLRDLLEDARARGLELGRPFDLVAVLLGFDHDDGARTPASGTAAAASDTLRPTTTRRT